MTRHNLPRPSQVWGKDVNDRLDALEGARSSATNLITYTGGSMESAVTALANRGVARFNATKARLDGFFSGGDGSQLLTIPIDWDDQGLNALITVRATVRAGQDWLDGFNNSLDTGTFIIVGITSDKPNGPNLEAEMVVPVVAIGGRPTYFGQIIDTFSVDYETFKDGYVYVKLRAPDGWYNIVNGTLPHSFVELATNTILL